MKKLLLLLGFTVGLVALVFVLEAIAEMRDNKYIDA